MDSPRIDDEAWDASAQLITLSGELDLASVRYLRQRVEAAFAEGPPQLVVDLSAVTHMDSTGLAELISAHQRAMDLQGKLVLVVTSAAIRRTLEIRGVVGLFTVVDSRAGARDAFAAG